MRKKECIAGALAAAIILAVPAAAKDQNETITAVYNNIKLIVDGASVTPKDAAGETVEPFIFNGTTYLPVRAVANAFNKPVEWDQENATVYLGAKSGKPAKSLSLWNRSYINCTDTDSISSKDNKGKGYIQCNIDVRSDNEIIANRFYKEESVTYAVNALAKTVSGKFYLNGGSRETEGILKILNSNGAVLYESPIMRDSTAPVEFNVNIEKEISFTFKFECTSRSYGSMRAYIDNPIIVSSDY